MWFVDDAPLERSNARRILEGTYDVELFADGAPVLERLGAGGSPDVVVLDWMMPGVTGIEVCKFLRSSPASAELPVLMITAQRETEQVVEGLRAGANDYLLKPYAPDEMLARVGALVRSRDMTKRAEAAESSLRTLLASLPEAVLLVDPQGSVSFANEEALRVFALAGRALLGRPMAECLPELRLPTSLGPPADALAHPDVPLGETFYAPLIRRLVQESGVSVAVSLRDVTEARRREARRLDFYAMVAHDLRSPLATIVMRVDWLLSGRRGNCRPPRSPTCRRSTRACGIWWSSSTTSSTSPASTAPGWRSSPSGPR